MTLHPPPPYNLWPCPAWPQLLLWDVRQGGVGGGAAPGVLMHFGGSGLYHHALLAALDLGPMLAVAAVQRLEDTGAPRQVRGCSGQGGAWVRGCNG